MNTCNCGKPNRYSHMIRTGEEVTFVESCNKYQVCLPYEELRKFMQKYCSLQSQYKAVLHKIANIEEDDHTYKCWARAALLIEDK